MNGLIIPTEPLWNSYQPLAPIIPPGTLQLIQPSPLIIPPPPTPTVQVINHMLDPSIFGPEPTVVVPGVPTYTPATQYVYTPPAVQPTPIAQPVQRAAIDPTLLLLGGVAVLALLIAALRK